MYAIGLRHLVRHRPLRSDGKCNFFLDNVYHNVSYQWWINIHGWIKYLEKLGNFQSCSNQSDEIEKMADCMSISQKYFPSRLRFYLVKYRYLTIAVLINMPGNYLLGGGGGISIVCGTSRRISWKGFLLTIALAVSPVPILAYLGIIQLETLLGI